jgi:hypothetical protein
LRYCASWA